MGLLLGILRDMNSIAQMNENGGILKAKIEKDCWSTILKIVKVLLTSAFVGILPSTELSLAL